MLRNIYSLSACFFLLFSFSSCEKATVDPMTLPEIKYAVQGGHQPQDSVSTQFVVPLSETYSFWNLSKNLFDYQWDFGDGHTSKDAWAQHAYEEPGNYTATLTGKAKDGRVHRMEKTIVVKEQFLKSVQISGFDWDLGFPLPAEWDVTRPTDVVLEIWSGNEARPVFEGSVMTGNMVYQSPVLKDVEDGETYELSVEERVPLSMAGLRDRQVINLRAVQGDLSVVFASSYFNMSGSAEQKAGVERFEWKTTFVGNRVILYVEMEK